MVKIIYLFSLLLVTGNISLAQSSGKNYKSLLWRISGNGLKKDSYLYGTMHLTDKRIFHFSDSLYRALEKAEGYALEVDINEMNPAVASELNERDNDDQLVKEVAGVEWLKTYEARLTKITGKKLAEITLGDLRSIKSKSEMEMLRNGGMPTIMDIYLAEIARGMDKWVGGIEDAADQFKEESSEEKAQNLVKRVAGDKKKEKEMIEWMVHTYLNQNVDAIHNKFYAFDSKAERADMSKRNLKMSRRMDSIMQIRTCFFAVGAAHLAGDSGVITLLRKKGYEVSPIYSNVRIAPEAYTFKRKEAEWLPVNISDEWYTVQMPGKAETVSETEGRMRNAKMYMDFSQMNGFFTFSLKVPAERLRVGTDSIMRKFAKEFSGDGNIGSAKDIEVNGTRGKDFLLHRDMMDYRTQTFLVSGNMVINMIASKSADSLYGNDANRFFNSFKVLKQPAESIAGFDWYRHNFDRYGFSIEFFKPYAALPKKLSADSAWKTIIFHATDEDERVSCLVMVIETEPGYYSNSDSSYFATTLQNIVASSKAELIQSKPFSLDGFPALDFSMKMKVEGQELEAIGRVVNRGNRKYYWYVANQPNDTARKEARYFLESFKLQPLARANWQFYNTPGGDLKLWSPEAPKYMLDSVGQTSSLRYIVYDSLSPATIYIDKSPLFKYAAWSSDSSFFKGQADEHVQQGDSLLDYKLITDGSLKGASFSVKLADNHNIKRVSMFLNADTLYSLYSYIPPFVEASADYRKLFGSFEIIHEKPSNHLKNKTAEILANLHNSDSVEFESAKNGLLVLNPSAADLKPLQQALLHPYRDFDPDNFSAHDLVIRKVLAVEDGSSVDFVRQHYTQLTGEREALKYSMLALLFRIKTTESYALAAELLTTQELPKKGNPKLFENDITDSLSLTAVIFPKLLARAHDTSFISVLASPAFNLIDSNFITAQSVKPYEKLFYALADRNLQRIKASADPDEWLGVEVVELMGRLKTPEAYKILQQFLRSKNLSAKRKAALLLLKNNQPVDPLQLEKLAASDWGRNSLYAQMEDIKKEKLFPVKYRNQLALAKGNIFVTANDEDETSKIVYLGERTAVFKGKKQKFFLFKVVYGSGEDELSYLGVTGPYPLQPGKLIAFPEIDAIYYDEEFDTAKTDQFFKALLKEWEGE